MVVDTSLFKNKLCLAPISGFTEVGFRSLCAKYGADVTVTEFTSASAIVRDNAKTFNMLRSDKELEKIRGVQIFGGSTEEIIRAAKIIDEQYEFDFLDLNCGCPAPKVIKNAAGSALLKTPDKIIDIISSLEKSISIPVTAKIRLFPEVITLAKNLEKAGASAIFVHGRTPSQLYTGHANWNAIKKIKKSVRIPVIGNGDIDNPEIAKKRLEDCGVDGLMIARASLRNPHIFMEIKDYLKKGTYEKLTRKEIFSDFLEVSQKHKTDIKKIRAHALHFSKGIPGGAKLREKISKMSLEELKELFSNFDVD